MKPLFRQVLAVLVGGALGAVCRVEIGGLVTAAAGAVLPVGILCVNMAGSFLLGLLTGVASRSRSGYPTATAFFATGFFGGFTTFSSFALDTVLHQPCGPRLEDGGSSGKGGVTPWRAEHGACTFFSAPTAPSTAASRLTCPAEWPCTTAFFPAGRNIPGAADRCALFPAPEASAAQRRSGWRGGSRSFPMPGRRKPFSRSAARKAGRRKGSSSRT